LPVVLTGAVTFAILALERHGFRPLEAVITAMIGVVAASYLMETFIVKPNFGDVVYHALVPQFSGAESILVATGILGATVMPHAIYLHSALTQNRVVVKNPKMQKKLFRYEIIDIKKGGMGIVYIVHDCQQGQMFAVKTFQDEYIWNEEIIHSFIHSA
jgi:manganese transport protein